MYKQITLNIEDESILGPLKKIINSLNGVSIAKPVKKRKSGIDEALDDIRHGRVTRATNVDEMFHDVLGI